MTSKHAATAREVSMFALVGLGATAVHYVVALALSLVMPVMLANPFGFIAAFGVSYVGHGVLTFRLTPEARDHKRHLPRFALTAFGGFLIGQALLMLLRSFTSLPDWLVLAIALGTVPVFTFTLSRFWVFTAAKS